MAYTNPTVTDFKSYFDRDFPFGQTIEQVRDVDVQRAIDAVTDDNFNPSLFGSQASYTLGYLLLAAHLMVMSLRASSQGIAGQFSWLVASKNVGNVAESFNIPTRILENPNLAILSKTTYGARYLFQILPFLTGNAKSICGGTHP